MKESALYIHIPFCEHKCIYCDFYSITTKDNIQSYLKTLIKEIECYSNIYSKEKYFTSIFFGGGTPSLMEVDYIKEIIESIKKNYTISEDCEITLETNPGTVDLSKLKEFKKAGINRLSIGIQSFDEDDLKFLTRIHNKEKALQTVHDAHKAGFNNINIDLIFNLPNQTMEKWKSNLEYAMSLPITHISAYSLILEQGTILNKMVLDKKVIISDDDYDADLYEETISYLTSRGFEQYEVSNFCKPGYECRHNNAYWRYKDYLSFGPSAHSFMNGKRWNNYSSLKFYIRSIQVNGNARINEEIIDSKQSFEEYIMLSLRSKGIDLDDYKEKFKKNFIKENEKVLNILEKNNYISSENNLIKLTPHGYAICDEIILKLLT